MNLYGDFPEAFWALPLLSNATIRDAKVKFRFPAQVSQNLVYMYVQLSLFDLIVRYSENVVNRQIQNGKIDGPIPDSIPWATLDTLYACFLFFRFRHVILHADSNGSRSLPIRLLEAVEVYCPLPAGLVNWIKAGNRMWYA